MVKRKKSKKSGHATNTNSRTSERTEGEHGRPESSIVVSKNGADIVPKEEKQQSKVSTDSKDNLEEMEDRESQPVKYDSPRVLLKPIIFLLAGVMVVMLVKCVGDSF